MGDFCAFFIQQDDEIWVALSHPPSEMWWVHSAFPTWFPLQTAAMLFLPASFSDATKQREPRMFLERPGILHDSKSWLVPWDYQGSSTCALYRWLFHSAQYTQYQIKASPHIYSCICISAHIWSTYSWYMYIFIFPYFWILIFYFSSTLPTELT